MPVAKADAVPPSRRRTQEERRDETRRRLLEATLACLVRQGYARTTTTEIVAEAGVSQGALFKHFPTKAALLGATVEHLFIQLVDDYRAEFTALSAQGAGLDVAFDKLWERFKGPSLQAAFELYMVARTDPELAQALHPVVAQHRAALVEEARRLCPEAAASVPAFDALVDLMMCAMEGLVVESYGAGDVTGPALAVLKSLMLGFLRGVSPARAGAKDKKETVDG